jgi:hypothetical protein
MDTKEKEDYIERINYIENALRKKEFEHDKRCQFKKELSRCESMMLSYGNLELYNEDNYETITLRYCPYCGVDIDLREFRNEVIKNRKKELVEKSIIKKGNDVYITRPNNSMWKGIGHKSRVVDIIYDENFDRLLYSCGDDLQEYATMNETIEELELYTNQPIRNSKK